MKVGFLHLSDIHIKTSNDPILKQASNIASATSTLWCSCDNFIVIVTGDAAYSGAVQEYQWAESFFTELRSELVRKLKTNEIHYIFIPGNHDCDFSGGQDLRAVALKDNSRLFNEDRSIRRN